MTDEPSSTKPSTRPYFIPAAIDFDTLPTEVKLAMIEIVGPAYEELVLMPSGALERSTGVTLVFLLAIEILDQFELSESINFSRSAEHAHADCREKLMLRHLRLVAAKQHASSFLARLRLVRARDPLRAALGS